MGLPIYAKNLINYNNSMDLTAFGIPGRFSLDMCDRAGQGGGISYMEREADYNECGKDGCCSG